MSGPATMPARAGVAPTTWAGVAIIAGVASGALAVKAPLALVLAAAAVVVVAVAYVTTERLETGVVLAVAALSLDTVGRIVSEPVAVTVFQALLLLCVLVWGVDAIQARRVRIVAPSWLTVGLALLIAGAALSVLFSHDRSATAFATVRLAFLALFTLLVATVAAKPRVHEQIVAVVVGSAAAMSVVALLQRFEPGLVPAFGSAAIVDTLAVRFSAFFHDPNFFAGFLSAAIAVAVSRALYARSLAGALAWLVVVPVALPALFVTMSRTGWAALLAGLVVAVATAPRERRKGAALGFVGVALAVALLVPASVADRAVSVLDPMDDPSLRTRVLMLESTAEIARDYWVFGVGLGAFDHVYPRYLQEGAALDIFNSHQVPLAIVAETGILGLIAQVVLVGLVVSLVWRNRRRWDRHGAASIAGLAVLATGSLFQNYLYFAYLWLFVGLIVAAASMARTEEGKTDDGA